MAVKGIEAVRELERDRFRAMVDADEDVLEALLADELVYVHTNGKRETKRQFIEAICAGRRRYEQIEVQSQEIVPMGDAVCLVSGKALLEMAANNGAIVFSIAYTAVQQREASGQWRLMAWQATRCATES
jgi:ketosteroid isomerase-like protein